jgi:hypothetical protein
MIICFKAKGNDLLDKFLNNWVNPSNPFVLAVSSTYVEFKVHRLDDYVLINQRNFYDVFAKFMLWIGVSGTATLWIFNFWGLVYIPITVFFFGVLWLSKPFRFLMIAWRLKQLGFKDKIVIVSDDEVIDKLLLRCGL